MINLILILIVGGLIGWIASIVMRTNAQQGILLNIVVGIVGALLAGFLLAPLFGTGNITSGDFSLPPCWSRCWAPSSCSPSSTCSGVARCAKRIPHSEHSHSPAAGVADGRSAPRSAFLGPLGRAPKP